MLILAEFEFDTGKDSQMIYEALLPELDQDYQRTKTTLGLNGEKMILKVQSNDMVSMRAALNGWLRLIRIASDICSFTSDAQAIN